MKPERWEQISQLFHAALARESDAEAFLKHACADDEELRLVVESLLAQRASAPTFLFHPTWVRSADVGIDPASKGTGGGSIESQVREDLLRQGLAHQYRLERELGRGGMATVYLADDLKHGRKVAIKTLHAKMTAEIGHQRFLREIEIAARLTHPHILPLHDSGDANGQLYYVMPYIEGESLRGRLDRDRPLPIEDALRLTREMAGALAYAHQRGVVHRDIKPANVLLAEGIALVADFGIARALSASVEHELTRTGIIMGTPLYMSPEQGSGSGEVDSRSDLYSLGCVLYEMLAGEPPFTGTSAMVVLARHAVEEPPPLKTKRPDIAEDLEDVVRKVLAKRPADRYPTVAHFVDALSAATSGSKVTPDVQARRVTAYIETTPSPLAPAVSERDAILLSDFVNDTGESIFDGTLRQALAVKLEESPYLSIVSDDRIQQTLRLMGRPPGERLTVAVCREICERQGIKAMVTGSIARLGRHYAVTLTTINCHSGDSIARTQVEATGKERVLSALGTATTRLRERLGESLASIERFDAALEDVTTSSLDALKAYSAGCWLRAEGNDREAAPHLKLAIELDPDFAEAYLTLGFVYSGLGELTLMNQCFTDAYERRNRATQREQLEIDGVYHSNVTGDLLKLYETLTVFRQMYPKAPGAYNQLGLYYLELGQFTRSVESFREAVRLAPEYSVFRENLAFTYVQLNRLDEAKTVLANTTGSTQHELLYVIACLEDDQAAMQREREWLLEHDPSVGFRCLSWTARLAGKLRLAREYMMKSADIDTRSGLFETAALSWLHLAQIESVCGLSELARRDILGALELTSSRRVAHGAAQVLAMSGFQEEAQPLFERCLKEYPPTDTRAKALYIPSIRAALHLANGDPTAAIDVLQSAEPYDVHAFETMYLRAAAFLAAKRPSEAGAEFQKLFERVHGRSAFGPVALLGRARALAQMGDGSGSRRMYETFLTKWKDADSDLIILGAAKQELARLNDAEPSADLIR